MKHEVHFDEKRGVLFLRFGKEVTPEEYREISKKIMEMPEAERHLVIIDITGTEMPKWSRETHKMLAEETSAQSDTRTVEIGVSPDLRIVSKEFVLITGKKADTRFFKTEEETQRWLKGEVK